MAPLADEAACPGHQEEVALIPGGPLGIVPVFMAPISQVGGLWQLL